MPPNSAPSREMIIAQEKVSLVDPHDCTDAKDALSLLHAAYDTLVGSRQGQIEPRLAQDWSVSRDARQWRFRLRDGVGFHDGSACTADTAMQSLRRMARPDKGYTLGAPGVWNQYLGNADIKSDGDRIITITLSEPLADLPEILAQGFIAAPSMIEAMDAGETPLPCGTGPYRIDSVEPNRVTATQVAGHFRAVTGPSCLQWTAEPDPRARLRLLLSGHIQVATDLRIVPGTASPDDITVHSYQNPVAIIFLLNAAKGPLADPRVRRALNLAIDRDMMVDRVLRGAADPLYGIMPTAGLGADHVRKISPDPSAARTLLAEAGHGAGLTLRLDCPTRLPDEAEALSTELERQLLPLGISLNITRHPDREAYAHAVRRKEIGDLCVFDSSPLSTFRVLYEKIDSRIKGSWWQGYANMGVEADLDRARRTTDAATRASVYAGIINALQQDPPWLTLYTPTKAIGLAGSHPDFCMPSDAVLDVGALPRV